MVKHNYCQIPKFLHMAGFFYACIESSFNYALLGGSGMIKKFLFRQVSFLETVAIVLVLIVGLYIISKDSLTFVIAAYSLLIGSALILLYLLFCWKRLDKNTRLGSMISILVWLFLLYGIVHARGLEMAFLWWFF